MLTFFCFGFTKFFLFSVHQNTKTRDTKTVSEIPQKVKMQSKLQVQFQTTLYYNMLESKTTEKCYRILELKLNLGQKILQILLRFYQT